MAEFKNNQFTNDTNDEHMLRANMCVTGMTDHPEVGFRGTLVADMTAHRDRWEALESEHAAEWGDEQAATAFTNLCEDELDDKLSSARFMVESMLAEEAVIGVTAYEIRRDFGIEQPKPRTRASRLALGKKMVETNARYVVELSPYALPEPFFTDLEAKVTALETAINTHEVEHDERLSAGLEKELERKKGDKLLQQAFKWVCAVLGPEDFTLLVFGFVPESQIWTPGSGEPGPGQAEWPEAVANFVAVFMTFPMPLFNLSWDLLLKAITYNLYRTKAPLGTPDKNRPVDPVETGLTEPLLTDTNIEQGNVYVYWICGVDEDGVEGEFGEPLVMEYV